MERTSACGLGLGDALDEETDARGDVGLAEDLDLVLDREIEESGDAVGEGAGVLFVEIELSQGSAGVTDELADLGGEGPRELHELRPSRRPSRRGA